MNRKIATRRIESLLTLALIFSAVPVRAAELPATIEPLVRVVDLNIGDVVHVELCDGSEASVRLLDVKETRDFVCFAVRRAVVVVEVNGIQGELVSATYHRPRTVGNVQIDCSVTKGYNENGRPSSWGLDKDARLRLWPAGSSLTRPRTFSYPVKQKWFASDTQMANDPVYVDGGERAGRRNIYYHSGLDIGGSEGRVEVVAATDGLVVSAGEVVLEGHKRDTPVSPRYDVVYLLDGRGWYYRYSHLKEIDRTIIPGRIVSQGDRIGLLGKEGGSGGWSHLHFEIKSRQPSGMWGTQEGYAFLWEAYQRQYQPRLIAVARPHQISFSGEAVTLDGTRSWSASGKIAGYEWSLHDGSRATTAQVTRSYPEPGRYSEVLRITDEAGHVAYDFTVVIVVSREHSDRDIPSIHPNFYPTTGIKPRDEVTFKVRTFNTTSGKEVWDFGDGSGKVTVQSDGNAVKLAPDGYATTTHRFESPGDYIVGVERTNEFGITAMGHLHVRVGDDVIDVGTQRELFVDDYLIDRLDSAERRLHHPTPREIAIVHDAPWEGAGSGYHTVLRDGDLYRMYHRGSALAVKNGKLHVGKQVYCYAESRDGIRFTKPTLGLFEYGGSKQNNIVWDGTGVHNFAPFLDTRPGCPPDAKFKALAGTAQEGGLFAFRSADGIRWSLMQDEPVVTEGAFDSQNLAFWDHAAGKYRAYFRTFTAGETTGTSWKPAGHRAIRTASSRDFLSWTDVADLTYKDSPVEHLYTNQIAPYYRAPHILIGFPTRYVERGWSDSMRRLPQLKQREERAAGHLRYGTALTEALLMSSRDGVHFERWNEAFLRPGVERPGTWLYGHQYIAWHAVETKSSLPGAPNELSLYATEGSWHGDSNSMRRYTLRLDGFVSVNAPFSGGELLTNPLRFSGDQLRLNFATSAAGSVRVEIQDVDHRPIPGFTLNDCAEVFGDAIDRTVRWKDGCSVSKLKGMPVRLRFALWDADLYAFRFPAEN